MSDGDRERLPEDPVEAAAWLRERALAAAAARAARGVPPDAPWVLDVPSLERLLGRPVRRIEELGPEELARVEEEFARRRAERGRNVN